MARPPVFKNKPLHKRIFFSFVNKNMDTIIIDPTGKRSLKTVDKFEMNHRTGLIRAVYIYNKRIEVLSKNEAKALSLVAEGCIVMDRLRAKYSKKKLK